LISKLQLLNMYRNSLLEVIIITYKLHLPSSKKT